MNIFKKIKLKISSYRRLKAYHSNIKRLAELELLDNPKKAKRSCITFTMFNSWTQMEK